MISHRLRRDCEQQIVLWAQRQSKGWRAQNGTNYELPARNPNYDGRELIKPLVTSSKEANAKIVSIYSKVSGNQGAIVRLHLSGFDTLTISIGPDAG